MHYFFHMSETQKTKTNNELTEALNRFAASDLRAAKKDGLIYITESKRGCLELEFDALSKIYSLAVSASYKQSHEILAQGTASTVRQALANLYDVETFIEA